MKKTLHFLIFFVISCLASYSLATTEEIEAPVPVFILEQNSLDAVKSEETEITTTNIVMGDIYSEANSGVRNTVCSPNAITSVELTPRDHNNQPLDPGLIYMLAQYSDIYTTLPYPSRSPNYNSIVYKFKCPTTTSSHPFTVHYDNGNERIKLFSIVVTSEPGTWYPPSSSYQASPFFYSNRFPGFNNTIVISNTKDEYGNFIATDIDSVKYRLRHTTIPNISHESAWSVTVSSSDRKLNIPSSDLNLPSGNYYVTIWKSFRPNDSVSFIRQLL